MTKSQSEKHPEIFRGHFDECFRHLRRRFDEKFAKGTREARQAKEPIATFCGCSVGTVAHWLRGGAVPVGEGYFKLMFFLELTGYKVIDLKRMPEVQRNFAELVGFSLITGRQAAGLLGYAATSKLYEVWRGACGSSKEKTQKMYEEWKKRKEELEQKKEKARKLCRLDLNPLSKTDEKIEPVPPVAVINIMKGLLTLLEADSLDGEFDDRLENLGQPTANLVLQLSARLSALSSQLIMSNQKERR